MSRTRLGLQQFRDADDPVSQAQAWLEAGLIAAERGNLPEARRLLQAAVDADPGCVEALFQLALLAEGSQEREILLRRILALDPAHEDAQAELARLQVPILVPPPPVLRAGSRRVRVWILAALVLVAIPLLTALWLWGPVDRSLAGLLPTPTPVITPTPTLTPAERAAQFEPLLQTALARQDWDRALEIVTIMMGVDPLGQDVERWATETHLQVGQAQVQAGQMDQALLHFEQALSLAPGNVQVQDWQKVTQSYLEGQTAFDAGDWPTAIQIWARARQRMPEYGDLSARLADAYRMQGTAALEAEDWDAAIESLTDSQEQELDDARLPALLATAYRQRGIASQQQGYLSAAKADFEAALELQPDDVEAQTHLDQVMASLFPPKKIEINISTQRFYAWEGGELLYSFPTSTGLPGQDTAPGNYQVLSKIPMAYSSIWNLSMPYWLGIYWVGSVENGIHALPIRPDGTVMWGGLLGTRQSYGCVILSTDAAQLVYNWADIGTAVHIHY